MLIKISPDLKKQELWATGDNLASIFGKDKVKGKRISSYPESKKMHIHTIKNPVLVTDNYKISKLKPSLRDSIFSLYTTRPLTTEYDGVSVTDIGYPQSVWSPSIDTILFAKALKKLFTKRKDFKKVIEVGTGSGFLSKYILKKNKNIKHLLINDLNKFAIQCAIDNIKDHRANFYAGNGLKKIKNEKFDLILCNPPYIPRPKSIDDNPYEGVGLLYDLIHNGQNYLNKNGILILNISSLCWDIVFDKKPKMKMELLEKMRVPLKVNNVLNNKNWVNYLEKNGLKKKYEKGYDYWQTINVVAFHNH